jgi:excinuclease ABC subunit C
MSGTDVVASMVVFRNGVSDRAQYRRFKIRVDKNDDYFNMNEVISRRFSEKNIKNWGKPDLVLIDGGKGQLDAAINARNDCNMGEIPFIGLAKRNEQIVVLQGSPLQVDRITEIGGSIEVTDGFNLINLPKSTDIIKLLQRIRDESHRFAVNYHTAIRSKKLLPKS